MRLQQQKMHLTKYLSVVLRYRSGMAMLIRVAQREFPGNEPTSWEFGSLTNGQMVKTEGLTGWLNVAFNYMDESVVQIFYRSFKVGEEEGDNVDALMNIMRLSMLFD